MRVVRRTLEANQHAAGSPERARLNLSSLTSEYLPGSRYLIVEDDGSPTCYIAKTKREAEQKLNTL